MPLTAPEKERYQDLIRLLDQEFLRIKAEHGSRIRCRPGCAECCLRFSVLPLEAAVLREAVETMAEEIQSLIRNQAVNQESPSCPLLVDERCSAYDFRPVICRTHGLPLAYIDEELQIIEVSACPINFDRDALFTEEDLLPMDRYNRRLAELNSSFCRERNFRSRIRVPIAEIFLFPRNSLAR